MHPRSLVIGYHGCDVQLANELAAGERDLNPSQNNYDWLGHGVYAWENSQLRASLWAEQAEKEGRIHKAAVIGLVIDLGYCLNLVETEALLIVREAYEEYRQACVKHKITEARNRGSAFKARFLDCAVFEYLHASRAGSGLEPFDTVRGFFVEGSELYPGAGLRDRDHIQICVRNPRCIKGYFLPK